MPPHPAIANTAEIVAELKAGRMVILVDEEDRENEGDLVMAAEHITPEAINFMAKYGRGLICLTLTEARYVVLGGGFLAWKGPTLVKNMAVSSLQRSFASLGIEQVDVDYVSLGWGRVYLRDIHTKP